MTTRPKRLSTRHEFFMSSSLEPFDNLNPSFATRKKENLQATFTDHLEYCAIDLEFVPGHVPMRTDARFKTIGSRAVLLAITGLREWLALKDFVGLRLQYLGTGGVLAKALREHKVVIGARAFAGQLGYLGVLAGGPAIQGGADQGQGVLARIAANIHRQPGRAAAHLCGSGADRLVALIEQRRFDVHLAIGQDAELDLGQAFVQYVLSLLGSYRQTSRGIFLHVQLHFVACHAAVFLRVHAVVALDRLDLAVFISNARTHKCVRFIDGFCQLERPVVWRAFLGTIDEDLYAVFRALAIGGECTGPDLVTDQQRSRWGDAAYGRPTTRKLRLCKDVYIPHVIKRCIGITDRPDRQDDMLPGFVRGDVAVVFGSRLRFLVAAVNGAERRTFKGGTLECFVRAPTVSGDDLLMFCGWMHSGVAPLEIDVAFLDFRHMPTGG